MKVETIRTQSNIKMGTVTQTLEVMGLKSKTTGPSAEWEWSTKEDKSNKVQTIDENSTEVQYPSAQAVYEAIQNIPIEEQIQSDWNQTDTEAVDFIKHKPNLATVATSGSYTDLTDKPSIPTSPVQSNWNENDSSSLAYIQNRPDLTLKENVSNKVTSISSGSTDTEYPSALAVYNYIQSLDGSQISY